MLKITVNDKKEFDVELDKNDLSKGMLNDQGFCWDVLTVKESCGCFNVLKDKQSYNASLQEANYDDNQFVISVRGNAYTIKVKDRYDQLLQNLGLENAFSQKINEIKAPMPGMVINIIKKAGDEVKKGDSILVLEAMKMENVIKSPTDGVIKKIEVEQDKAVDKNQLLLTFA